jgi:Nucleotidyltransferase domain
MKNHSRTEFRAVAKELKELLGEPAAIVLVGSVARNCATQRSDVDILVVGERLPVFKLRPPNVEFHAFSAASFLSQLKSGDDFPNWCTRFGVPLADTAYWESILHKAEHASWPDWKRKITVASRRLLASRLSLRTGDREAAAEGALFAYDHLIRGILLREAIFPLSRPELVEQIRPLSPELGKCLSTLLHDSTHSLDFRHLFGRLMGALKNIDPEMHSKCDETLRKILSGARAYNNVSKIMKSTLAAN